MAVTFPDIEAQPNGARFYNADLHVHSYGASHDVTDISMTPEAIVDEAVRLGIRLLALTDHNTAANTVRSVEYAAKYHGEILVMPGVEVSTAHGHLLTYFDPADADCVVKLLAKINLVGKSGDQNAHTAMSMADVITEASRLGGICIAAHIDRAKTGFETIALGYPNWKKDILLHPGLYGLECDAAATLKWFSEEDEVAGLGAVRRSILLERVDKPETIGHPCLGHLQGSDAHSLVAFTTGRVGKILTRFKLDELTFSAFRVALSDPEARVRPVASIPLEIPRILGMHVTGGFLDGEIYRFSDNLNCFIGGRGTGKSSALQTLAYGLGINDSMGVRGNCPGTIITYCEDANGTRYRYERVQGSSEPVVKAKEGDGDPVVVAPDTFRVEYYSQGELAKVGEDPLKSPDLFQEFLDRHLLLRDLFAKEEELVSALEHNSAQMIPLETNNQALPAKKKEQGEIDVKLKVAEDGKLKDIAAEQTKLSAEKTHAIALGRVANEYKLGLTLSNFSRDYAKLETDAKALTNDPASVVALENVKAAITRTNQMLRAKESEINAVFIAESKAITGALAELGLVHKQLESQCNAKITSLQAKGLAGSITELQNLLTRRQALTLEIGAITNAQPGLAQLRKDREEKCKQLADVREQITARRKGQLVAINKNLARTIQDYSVFVHFEPAGITTKFKEFILEKMQGTYFQEETANEFCSKISPAQLAMLMFAGDINGISVAGGVTTEWAAQIWDKLKYYSTIHALEVMWKTPYPIITVKSKGTPPKIIPVNQLSDGQKHTIMLTIAMLAESNIPLIIDQPEDDLDNAFIFSAVVRVLRAIKEHRQVVLVTHNANIAVLGDAELLLPMKRSGDCGAAFDRGSIDAAETKRAVINILEGGDRAFQRRREIYRH